MIRGEFNIEKYWKVIVYFDVDYSLSGFIEKELERLGFSEEPLEEMWDIMSSGEAKAVTCSNVRNHVSVVLFNNHISKEDYINSIVHESEHVKQAVLEVYDVEDSGESPAYTVGYIVMKIYSLFIKAGH